MGIAAAVDLDSRTRTRGIGITNRLAGAGGLAFVATLVVQNVLRANAPSFDAQPGTVSAYFVHPGAAVLIPLGLFPVGMLALFTFVAALWAKADSEQGRWWAGVGILGTAAIVALFAIVNISEIVLAAKADQLASSPAVVQALWTLHAAAFGLDLGAIAVALIGLSRAAASIALVRPWLAIAALPAAACLLTASVFTVGIANGGPWMGLGLVGFLVWLVFVVTASISLLRSREIR